MSEWENLEQIEQINSELSNVAQLSSTISSEAQLTSTLGTIVVLGNDMVYIGTISESDWVKAEDHYVYTISQDVYQLRNATLFSFLVLNNGVYENSLVGFTISEDGLITIISDLPVIAKFTIQGEK